MARAFAVFLFLAVCAHAQPVSEPCPRPAVGAIAAEPPSVYSANGVLSVELTFRAYSDVHGNVRYCYIAADGSESPTLRVHQNDQVVIRLKNDAPFSQAVHHEMELRGPCGGGRITASTTNLHFHGLGIPPSCHADDVISTLVQPVHGVYDYRFRIPPDQPPGLYWYHPHPHGFSEAQVLGGASGALIVEGIERANAKVAGLPERVLILRDQRIAHAGEDPGENGGPEPAKDLSINFVPILYPANAPAALVAKPSQREFWRVLNAAADTYFLLQIRTGPSLEQVRDPLSLEIVALDGAPSAVSKIRSEVLLPPGARAEFILQTPPEGTFARLFTLRYNAGPAGESMPPRILANLFSSAQAPSLPARLPAGAAPHPRASGALLAIRPSRKRKLYFSEERSNPDDPTSPLLYYVTVEGRKPRVFDMNFTAPDIVVRQGAVEDWVIENRSTEAHAFHIHQIHFQLLERDGQKLNESALRDTVDLPFWDGKSRRFPSVRLRMDFRDPNIVGTFLFHCHILEHEDGGMMGAIRVDPAPRGK